MKRSLVLPLNVCRTKRRNKYTFSYKCSIFCMLKHAEQVRNNAFTCEGHKAKSRLAVLWESVFHCYCIHEINVDSCH